MEDMKGIPKLSYTSSREALAEKFHMSEDPLAALNPDQRFDRAGDTIAVVDIATDQNPEMADRVEVDKRRQTVKLFDKSNTLIGFYPATVGSEEKPSPMGILKVTEIDRDPIYHYNPAYHFKGVHSRKPFIIRPGRTIRLATSGSISLEMATAFMARLHRARCPNPARTGASVLRIGMPSALPDVCQRAPRSRLSNNH
jgi:hypothetical protein